VSARLARWLPLSCALLAACHVASSPTEATSGGGDPLAPEHPDVGAHAASQAAPTDLSGGALPPLSRGIRRMRIDTLQASMTRVAGKDLAGKPIQWRYGSKDGFADDAFGKILGRPDYQTVTDESGVSNALYLKLVGDAARDICTQMVKADVQRAADARALFPKAAVDGTATDAQVNENLRYLVLRFFGMRIAEDDPMVASVRQVFDAAKATTPEGGEVTPSAEGWRAVCVALFESPMFHND